MKEDRNKALQDMLRHLKGGDSKNAMEALKRSMSEEAKKDPSITQSITQAESHLSKFSEADTAESKKQSALDVVQDAEKTLKACESQHPTIQALAAYTQNLKVQLMEPSKEKQSSLFPQQIKELKARAFASYKSGDYATAISLFKTCLDLYNAQKVVDENNVASTAYNLGSAYWKNQDGPSALVYLNQALEIKQKKGDEEGCHKTKQLIKEIQETLSVESKSSPEVSM